MLTPNQIRCLNDYYSRAETNLYYCCERHDCDFHQMEQIVNELDPLLPGKGLDYEAILSKDPIASDPLLIHCNQTIGRLDELYKRMMIMHDASSQKEFVVNKRTTVNVPPDWAKPSFHDGQVHFHGSPKGSEKVETTSFPDKQRFKILETAMKCLDRSVKIQITCTQRREKLMSRANSPRPPATQSGAHRLTAPHSEARPDSGSPPLSGMTAQRGCSINGHPHSSPTEKFGPAKEFTSHPALAELEPDRYAWRKELKAKQRSLSPAYDNSPPNLSIDAAADTRTPRPVSRDAQRSAPSPQQNTSPTANASQPEASARNPQTATIVALADPPPHHQRE